MSAFLIGHIKVRDETLWQHYVAGVRESLAPFDAQIVFRGLLASVLAGQSEHDRTVVIQFADMGMLNDWYQSEKYQSLIPLRDQAADVVITAFQES